MKYILLLITFLGCITPSEAQHDAFNYDSYFYYRNHLYLGTSSIRLNGAGLKLAAGDTAAAIRLIYDAASAGMYDTIEISARKSLAFVTKTPHWDKIKTIITTTRQKFGNPEQMDIVTTDIENFWKCYPSIREANAEAVLMEQYVMKGSPGLRTFFENRMSLRIAGLIQSVKKQYKYYESIRDVSLNLKNYKPALIDAAKKFKTIYPEAIFPPTYFVMSHFTAFGTADGGAGQLIGAEFLCNPATADTTQLGKWEKSTITDSSKIAGILIHELVHIQQKTKPVKTLLERSINEGAADFITQLILNYNINSKLHFYGDEHEFSLWEKFTKQMNGENTDDWLYNGTDNKRGYPGDLGYYIGYKICAAYYDKATDKKKAVKDILEIQDFNAFLLQSGYRPVSK